MSAILYSSILLAVNDILEARKKKRHKFCALVWIPEKENPFEGTAAAMHSSKLADSAPHTGPRAEARPGQGDLCEVPANQRRKEFVGRTFRQTIDRFQLPAHATDSLGVLQEPLENRFAKGGCVPWSVRLHILR